ncbi:MAG: hypothetical protein V7731_00425 [Amphritea sp.]
MISTDHTQQVSIGSQKMINVEELLLWRDPHCPSSQLLQEEFSYVRNDFGFPFDSDDEQTSH